MAKNEHLEASAIEATPTTEVKVPEAHAANVVSREDYDKLLKEYNRVATAFNRAIGMIANEHAEKVAKAIFDEIDRSVDN